MHINKLTFVVLLAALFASRPATAGDLTVSVGQGDGLPAASMGGVSALTSNFVFWRKDWAWAGLSSRLNVVGPYAYEVRGSSKSLHLELHTRIRKDADRKLVWDFAFDAEETTPDAIGGGISFKPNLAAFSSHLGEPQLLPGNRGWVWGTAARKIEVRFDPPMAAVYFERGNKSEIRAFFYKGAVPRGRREHTATLTLTGDIAIGPTEEERFGLDDPARWPTGILDWRTAPVDLSFLNASERPAGKRGLLRAKGDKLVFEDGTQARFWGTNLTAGALFGTMLREDIAIQARRLSQLGFNLVRLHHHDSPWVNPNIFGKGKSRDTTTLSVDALATLDWWIKCLQDEGIYVWLDLHVQRALTAKDGIDGFDEIRKGKESADLKGYNYVNASIQQAMQRFNEAYVNHVNKFTGKRYKDDPAIIAMLITNENDVTHHFGNALLPDKKVPQHNAVYMKLASAFAGEHGLPKNKTWRSWEQGPSKIFLNDLERRFHVGMIAHLRGQGVKAPLVTTSTWGGNSLSSLPSLTLGDIIDVHSYGRPGAIERNPLQGANYVHWLAAGQIAGRPMSVTEWNVSPFPAPDRHSAPLYVAAAAGWQGWDAMMQYAYSQSALKSAGGPSNWQTFNDPGMIATLPAAALLYRRGDLREAQAVYAFSPTPEQLFHRKITPDTSVALRTAAEKGKLVIAMPAVPELPWLQKSAIPPDAILLTDPDAPVIAPDASDSVSDTGEIARDWEDGIYTIDTPRTQAATGWLGGKEISLRDVQVAATTRNASVAVQSLDGKPISEARRILVSLGARSEPSPGNKLPFRSEPVTGSVTIRAPAGLKLYAQGPAADKRRALPVSYEDGRYLIALDESVGSYWLVLR
jgi:hypothetical protein